MSWVYLIIAGIFEVGWPLGFKLASTYTKYSVVFIGISVISMALGGVFLYIAQKTIPGDSANFWRLFFITMIIIGVIGTKIVH